MHRFFLDLFLQEWALKLITCVLVPGLILFWHWVFAKKGEPAIEPGKRKWFLAVGIPVSFVIAHLLLSAARQLKEISKEMTGFVGSGQFATSFQAELTDNVWGRGERISWRRRGLHLHDICIKQGASINSVEMEMHCEVDWRLSAHLHCHAVSSCNVGNQCYDKARDFLPT